MAATVAQHHNVSSFGQEQLSSLPSVDQSSPAFEVSSPAFEVSSAKSSEERIKRGPVSATLNFFKEPEDGAAPYNIVSPQAGEPQRNFGDNEHQITFQDVRGRESEFSLDKHAFEVAQNKPHNEAIDWYDDENIKKHYYPEVEQLLLEYAKGSNRVLIFDHTIRRAGDAKAQRGPVLRAHIDQTSKAAKQRVGFHLPEEEEKLLAGRYRIINVWRPINGKVETSPLGFAASSTVPETDMVPIQHRYPDRTGETAAIRYNPDHQWYYLSGIGDDERIFLQCYDSANPSTRVPHSAFVDPRTTSEMKPRESIEVRALVFG